MSDVLSRICARRREDLAARRRAVPLAVLEARLREGTPPRGFAEALRAVDAGSDLALIAEIKKASPSRGLIRADFDPPALARAYAEAGASCLSVLTETAHFQGTDRHLEAARGAVGLPVLRKDFTLDPYQVVEARAIGADAVLVILAAVEDGLAAELMAAAHALGMDVLVEIHDAAELERAMKLGATVIGINNRDLKTLEVDLDTGRRLAPLVPADRLVVAESGLSRHADLLSLREAGARAFLVGESLMREPDLVAATRRLLGRSAAA